MHYPDKSMSYLNKKYAPRYNLMLLLNVILPILVVIYNTFDVSDRT